MWRSLVELRLLISTTEDQAYDDIDSLSASIIWSDQIWLGYQQWLAMTKVGAGLEMR